MADKKEVFVRCSTSDIVLSKEQLERATKYAQVVDDDGKTVTETEIYLIGYEFEDGTECDEDGNKL